MPIMNVFKTTTTAESPLDGSTGTPDKAAVSDFLTIQTFTNFAAMTGAITAAWHGLQRLTPHASTLLVPYACAFVWAIISVLISLEGLTKGSSNKEKAGTILQAIFLAAINSLVLGGAVVGTNVVAGQIP